MEDFHGLLANDTVPNEKTNLYIVAKYTNYNCNWMGSLNSALKIEILIFIFRTFVGKYKKIDHHTR